jgi:pimeloyl-ACP methyl ester carboxylesterase
MWISNIEAFSQKCQAFAVDNINDPGRSIFHQELSKPEDFITWLDELFNALDLGRDINLVGLAYGSWLAHLYALHFPQRVSKIVLLAHPAIVSMNLEFILRFLLSIISPRVFQNFVYWLFQDTLDEDPQSKSLVEGIYHQMRLAGKCFKPKKIVNPTKIKDHQLTDLLTPALFLFGENEKTFSPQKAIQRLRTPAPQVMVELIPRAGHDLSFAQSDMVNQKILQFFE